MIKYICDLCGKEADELNTIILYKKYFQHCRKCNQKANLIKSAYRKETKEEYLKFEKELENIERSYLEYLRRNQ